MKRFGFLIMAATVAAVMGCKEEKLVTQKFGYVDTDSLIVYNVEYPVSGNVTLINSIRGWISEQMGGNYSGNISNGGQMVEFYGKNFKMQHDVPDQGIYSGEFTIEKTDETRSYVTFHAFSFLYLGGAHGSTVETGETFRKTDGRRMGARMLAEGAEDGLQDALIEGLVKYYSLTSEEKLDRILFDFVPGNTKIPLPQKSPFLREGKLVLQYSEYEICPYALGRPVVEIPLSSIDEFLTPDAKEMIEQGKARK